jgi:hypothetical protein
MALIRTDSLFALTVALAALAGWRAWNRGHGWTWFWLAASMATLTKGPLGLFLAAGGLLAALWERRSGEPHRFGHGHLLGIFLYVSIPAGWLLLAYHSAGWELISKLIVDELFGHSVSAGGGENLPLLGFYRPPYRFLLGFLPWSIPAAVALWRVAARPSADRDQRRLERFLFCWFVSGFGIFCLAASHRPDHLLPLLPAAALLGGRELQRWRSALKPAIFYPVATTVTAAMLCFVIYDHASYRPRMDRTIRASIEMKLLAHELTRDLGRDFPFTYVDAPFSLQFHLRTMHPHVNHAQAAELLRSPTPAFIIVRDLQSLRDHMADDPSEEIYNLDMPMKTSTRLKLISNHPHLERTDTISTVIGPIRIDLHQARLVRTKGGNFFLEGDSVASHARFENISADTQRIRIHTASRTAIVQDMLEPGQNLDLPVHAELDG